MFPYKYCKIFKKFILKNICERLLLSILIFLDTSDLMNNNFEYWTLKKNWKITIPVTSLFFQMSNS